MKDRKKLKGRYSQHKAVIKNWIFPILLFISGYLISWNSMKPLDNKQFELGEQIARDVYAQKADSIIEESKDFSVSITATSIIVESANNLRGKVIAKLQNGELVMTRDMETGEAVFSSIVMGVLCIMAKVIIVILADIICEETKKKSGE